MQKLLLIYLPVFCIFCILHVPVNAQSPADSPNLFTGDSALELTLSGNIRELLNDRLETPTYHPLLLLYKAQNGNEISVSVEAKTRGHFRKLKENCIYPPLAVHFTQNDALKHSLFKDQDKLKLVMPCVSDDYIVKEWLVYKLYNLVTPNSFKARLVKVKLDDTKNKKTGGIFYGILLEEEKEMAKRNGMIAVNRKLQPNQTEPIAFLTMAVFEYLAGNTDWSVQYLQNIKLVATDSMITPIAVPYDFDHAGLVNAPYAKPAEELLMSSVRQRRYRGYCVGDMKKFDPVITFYNQLKNSIYQLYTTCNLLDEKYKTITIKYLDEFYATINDADKMKKAFGYPCDKKGTGNVVIKGLKED